MADLMSSRFVGRRRELDALRAARDAARNGRGTLVAIVGDPGIGKTRLVEECLAAARDESFVTAWGSGWPDGDAPPFWPWHEVLAQFNAADGVVTLEGARSAHDGGPDRFTMYRSTHAAIERAAAMRPALIVLDDAHAIDPSALALARFVVRASRRSPILVVLTARPTGAARTESGDAFADLVAEGEIVQLGALERDDVASLLEDAGRPAGESDVSALLELAGGSPLLIREALMSPGSFTGAPLPNRARHLLATRLGGFGPTAKRVLAAAAVVGPRVTHAEVAATAGVGIEDVAQIRAEATRDGLLRDSVGEQFAFDHELLRRALLDDVGAAVTAELQQRAADVIEGEATTADRLERIAALRLAAAGELGGATLDRAVAAARTAARALAGPYGHESAAPLLRSACTALERGGQEPAADLLIELGKAEYARGRLEVARTVFGHAIDRADDDPVEFAEAVLGLGLLTVFEHRTALDADRYRELLATATRRVPQAREDLRARLAIRQAVESWHDGIGPLDDVVAAAQLITSTAEASSAVDALSSVVHVLLGPHHAAQRASLIAELSEFAARSNDAFVALLATMWSTVHLVLTGAGEPQRTITELHQRADALRVRSVFYVAELMQSMLLLRRGQLDEAEKAMTANFERGIELGDADAFGYFAGQLMVLRWLQARTDEIVDVARQASVEPTVMAGDVVYRAAFAAIAADVGGDVEEEARRELDGIATSGLQHIPTGSNWLVSMASIVEAAARIHDAEVADEARRLLAPYRAFPIMGSLGSVCLGPVSRVLGLAAVTSGDREAGIEDLELAIADARRIGNRPFLAIARADLGTVLLADDRLDRRQRGRVLIEQAKAAMRSMGMARRADRLAEMHDRDTEDAPPCTLTRTDSSWEVVGLGQRAVVPDSRGMCYLGHLLANPGLDVGADELAGSRVGGDRQDIIDETARSVYGARIRELRAQLDDADIVGDAETSHKLQSELDALVAELAASTGLGRRTRTFIDDRERARTAVRKAIRRSVDRIAEQAPSLGMLLRATIVTGGVCRYEPADPERVSWIVRER